LSDDPTGERKDSKRTLWSSQRAFILSTAAAAVGLGNLWRFPYMAGEHGGAAFILAYLISVIFIGLPIMILEFALGRRSRGNTVAMFSYLSRRVKAVGWLVVGLTTIIISYYLVITGWTMGYAVSSIVGNLQPFAEFTDSYNSLWYFVLACLATAAIVAGGVAGIERFSWIMMPALALVVIGLAVYGLTMPGRDEAISFMLSPDFATLRDPGLWLFAVGQAFYSLAVGSGYLVTYGSFMDDDVCATRTSSVIAGTEVGVALLSGLVVFPAVFTFGFSPDAGSQLAFDTLPRVFELMGGGSFLAPVFFLLFFNAALSSCVGGMKVIARAVHEQLALPYRNAVLVTLGILLALGAPSALSFTPISLSLAGRPFLEVIDMFAGTQVVVASGLMTGALIAWLVPRKRLTRKLCAGHDAAANFIVSVGRYLPVVVLAVLLYTWLS